MFNNLKSTQTHSVSNKMPNYKKTEELTLKLIKGQPHYKYYRSSEVVADHLVCRQTRDAKGNIIPLLDKEGNPIYY